MPLGRRVQTVWESQKERRERKEQRDYLKKQWQKCPKFEEGHGSTSPESSVNFKQEKPKETHTKTCCNKIIQRQKILKASKKQLIIYQRASVRLSVDFSIETLETERQWDDKVLIKSCQPIILYLASSRIKEILIHLQINKI